MSSCSNIFAISLFERIGIVCPGGSLTGASVILFLSGAARSASSLRSASATRSRSVDPRFTAAILARFSRSSGRSNVERINMTICFRAPWWGLGVSFGGIFRNCRGPIQTTAEPASADIEQFTGCRSPRASGSTTTHLCDRRECRGVGVADV